MNEIVNENTAATTISSVLRGHEGRKTFKFNKDYPVIAVQRRKQVENMTKVFRLQDTQPPSYTGMSWPSGQGIGLAVV
jgi:hypothetical protein